MDRLYIYNGSSKKNIQFLQHAFKQMEISLS